MSRDQLWAANKLKTPDHVTKIYCVPLALQAALKLQVRGLWRVFNAVKMYIFNLTSVFTNLFFLRVVSLWDVDLVTISIYYELR